MADSVAQPNAAQIAHWNAAAGETWVALQDQLDAQIAPLGRRAIDALAPQTGERIVDIGCGCGQTSLQLAEATGPHGRVLGLDVSRPMLAVARARAAALPAGEVDFREGDAQVHAFEPASIDAVYSRFGVMFFADPTAAFGNLRRALRPGGRLAFVCWRGLGDNPWMRVPLTAALQHLHPPPPPNPTAPGPFALADGERVRSILEGAGFQDITVSPHDQQIGHAGLDQTVALALRVGPLGALLREQPEQQPRVAEAIREAVRPFLTPDGVRMDSATWIVRAHAP